MVSGYIAAFMPGKSNARTRAVHNDPSASLNKSDIRRGIALRVVVEYECIIHAVSARHLYRARCVLRLSASNDA